MIKLIKSTFYNEAKTKRELGKFIVDAKWLSLGPECLKFEKSFAKYQGRKHCIFYNSGSMANLALIQALLNLGDLKRNESIGFSAVTWSTNVMPLIQLGLKPVPVDVDLATLNVSSQKFSEIIKGNKLKAFFLTNLLGFCHDPDKIRKLCAQNGIMLIEDNCEALGTVYKGTKLGNFGLASTFSFFVGHHMSTIEGGAVCTDNDRLASMLKMVRAHGWDRNLELEEQGKLRKTHNINDFYSRYTFYDLSFNLRPTEINAFLGSSQLKYINQITKKRETNFLKVAKAIYKRTDKYYPIKFDHIDLVSNFAIPLICKSVKIRDELLKKCEGIVETRPVVAGDITKQPFFRKYLPSHKFENTNTELIHKQGFYVGNNPDYTKKELDKIISILSA